MKKHIKIIILALVVLEGVVAQKSNKDGKKERGKPCDWHTDFAIGETKRESEACFKTAPI